MKIAAQLGFIAMLIIIFGTGCSSFERDWKRAVIEPAATGSLEGPWAGTWQSDVNGHQGILRCLVTRQTNGLYAARFHAKYRKVLTYSYTVPLTVQRQAGQFVFEGEENLGWLAGGRYDYRGHAGGTNFFSTYRCEYDHGTFRMTRPPVAP